MKIRFTVRRLMLAVALVALPLAAIKPLYFERKGVSVISMKWFRYDDPTLSPDERQAVRFATEAVLDPGLPRSNFDDAFLYKLGKQDGEWFVVVWCVSGFRDNVPEFMPGGFTIVLFDRNFKVKRIIPGE